MKKTFETRIAIPSGINCKISENSINCSKGGTQINRLLGLPNIKVEVSGNEMILSSNKANKKEISKILSQVAHIKNIFLGLNERFVYELEICNVHFTITVKIEGSKFVINNFLGEKIPRVAKILSDVEIKVEGSKIKIMSANIESAGQTAANLEKASRVRNKDRRIFQDGIFITKKPEVIL